MYSFEHLITWVVATLVGIVASTLQDALKRGGHTYTVDQRLIAIVLSVVVGLLAWGIEGLLGYDLFADITQPEDLLFFILQVLSANQIFHGFTRK